MFVPAGDRCDLSHRPRHRQQDSGCIFFGLDHLKPTCRHGGADLHFISLTRESKVIRNGIT